MIQIKNKTRGKYEWRESEERSEILMVRWMGIDRAEGWELGLVYGGKVSGAWERGRRVEGGSALKAKCV